MPLYKTRNTRFITSASGPPVLRRQHPGAVPRTSTFALTNSTLPYALTLAQKGFRAEVLSDAGLAAGVNTYAGKVTYEAVALSQGRAYTPLDQLLKRKVSEAPA